MAVTWTRYGTWTLLTVVALSSGCDTIGAREEIWQRTTALGDTILKDPKSAVAAEAMQELIDILNGNWSFGSTQAAGALKKLGPLAAPAVPDLIRAAEHSDMFTQAEAIAALGEIGPSAAPSVDMLIRTIEKGLAGQLNTGLDWKSAESLGKIGMPAIKAIPVLESAILSNDERLVRHAKRALEQLRPLAEGIDAEDQADQTK